ncbi:ribonuclease H-like protein, partial [Ascobolus immersus RN42]
KALAIDCEMIEMEKCEAAPTNSGLARLSIVNYDGEVLLDTIVRPPGRILHCRSKYTGLTYDHFKPENFDVMSFQKAQKLVLDYVRDGHVIVGHALDNDLVALNIKNEIPVSQTRDTSRLGTVLEKYGWSSKILGLKKMTEDELGRVIQTGFHDSVVDARATMEIYRKYEKELDQEV